MGPVEINVLWLEELVILRKLDLFRRFREMIIRTVLDFWWRTRLEICVESSRGWACTLKLKVRLRCLGQVSGMMVFPLESGAGILTVLIGLAWKITRTGLRYFVWNFWPVCRDFYFKYLFPGWIRFYGWRAKKLTKIVISSFSSGWNWIFFM